MSPPAPAAAPVRSHAAARGRRAGRRPRLRRPSCCAIRSARGCRRSLGIVCFIAVVAAFSTNLRAVNWRTVGWGIALQVGLALLILKLEIGGVQPGLRVLQQGRRRREAVPGVHERRLDVRVRPAGQPAGDGQGVRPGQGLRVRVHGAADDHLRLVVLHRALLLRRPAADRPGLREGDDVRDADERRRDAVGRGERVHGPDRGADHRQAVRAPR